MVASTEGTLLSCDAPAITQFLKHIDRTQHAANLTLKELDATHLLVRNDAVDTLTAALHKMQDANAFAREDAAPPPHALPAQPPARSDAAKQRAPKRERDAAQPPLPEPQLTVRIPARPQK